MEHKHWLLIITWVRLGKTDEYWYFTFNKLREAISFLRHIQERQGHEWVQTGNDWEARCLDPEQGEVVFLARWKHTTWK